MSIEYSAVITHGYLLNAADMKSLTDDQIQELYDTEYLKDYNTLNYADWKNDENWHGIFGLTADYCDESDYPTEINPSRYTEKDNFITELFNYYFPNNTTAKIGTYLNIKIS